MSEQFRERTGIAPLERYGLTESGLKVSNLYDGERALGGVGYPFPGVELSLLDGDGSPVATGEEGEIVLRGAQLFTGYLDDADATREAFWPGGWFRTGDIGHHDAAGRLVISGRLKDLVITGGMSVSPLEVEQAAERMPGVREVAVGGVSSELLGEEVTAWVVSDPAARVRESNVVAFCRERVIAFKCSKHVHFVDRLLRNPLGKIACGDLPEWGSAGG